MLVGAAGRSFSSPMQKYNSNHRVAMDMQVRMTKIPIRKLALKALSLVTLSRR